MNHHFDVAIIGSGFSGSILGRVLATRGRRVCLIDAATHPRFAIGESSTPIADLMLRRIGEQFGLDDLTQLSSFGTWQKSRFDLACGLKRGFSYFDQRHDHPEQFVGERSLIVAASPTDARSDTHWYRSDVDAFLFRRAVEAGVVARESEEVTNLKLCDDSPSHVQLASGEVIDADLIVDASGAAAVSARSLGIEPMTDRLRTRSCAAFAHFRGVKKYSKVFNQQHGDQRADVPFDADDTAQHHLIDGGWVWMLRMNNGVTSVGVTSRIDRADPTARQTIKRAVEMLRDRFGTHSSMHQIMRDSQIVTPPGIGTISRVQRFYDPIVSNHCVMLPTTAVSIDPLHSTGIAHGLAGVYRIANWILDGQSELALNQYRNAVCEEAIHIDRMIAMAYHSMSSFRRFSAACMVYFAAAIRCEERLGAGEVPAMFWQADDDKYVDAVRQCDAFIRSHQDDQTVLSRIRQAIEPWNTAGLFESSINRYAYTATK